MSHQEKHIYSSQNIKDIVIGMADGLTVPFALAAGLSGVVDSSHLVVAAGLAEVAAGSIAMGLGGYLAAKSDDDHYVTELNREWLEVQESPQEELREVEIILKNFGVPKSKVLTIAKAISKNPDNWVNFMMKFELGLNKPDCLRIYKTPLLIGSSYVMGGILPLSPYMITGSIEQGFYYSCIITVTSLAIFGGLKGYFTGISSLRSAIHTTLIGSLAAAAAYFIAGLF